ncbi:MAG: tetratricopeptide repeat protein [Bacteroidetes bacterium]|nr:hypothetical protein [Bacteroidota bacterium]MCL4817481.1 tetratricopeptide repeat protein [Flavobacteriales bacterium]NOG96286.1 tetratricopeptide repeat protein [Bacteroidota bacterium]WKZ76334.1 MAG: tetratricopeptide repeat protein [Vicingaceae bacterium]CAG0996493.1 hypothetical protein FLAV_02635 [Flavobacteriales bacterium]
MLNKKYLRLVFFYLLASCSTLLLANTTKRDSLIQKLNKSKQDTIRVNILNEIGEITSRTDLNTKLKYTKEALGLAEKLGFANGIARACIGMSNYYAILGVTDSNEIYLLKAEKILLKIKNKSGLAKVYGNIGALNYGLGNLEKSLSYFQKASSYFEQTNDKANLAKAHILIASILQGINNFKDAMIHLQSAEIINKELNNEIGLVETYLNIGIIHKKRLSLDTALTYYNKALVFAEKKDDKFYLAKLYNNIGNVYLEKNDFKTAISYYDKSIPLRHEMNDWSGLNITYSNLALIYSDMGKYDQAINLLKKCEEISLKEKDKRALMVTYKVFSETYSGKKDFKNAFEYFAKYSALRDTLFNDQSSKVITDLEKKYETEKKDQEIQLLNKNNLLRESEIEKKNLDLKRRKTQNYALAGGFGFMIILSVLIFKSYKRKKKDNELITKQKDEVVKQKEIIEYQKNEVDEKNKEILDSIKYAKRLQEAILPPKRLVKEWLPNSFIIYKPKDIVAGDFYWMESYNETIYFAAADCTGHGVPGAMVSVICCNALNKSLIEENITEPAKILDRTRDLIIERFSRSEEDMKDGMDISLCSIDWKKMELSWAGANNPVWIINPNRLGWPENVILFPDNKSGAEIKANKQPIGNYVNASGFTNHSIKLEPGDTIYIFTDGFQDQFGGEMGKKFKASNLKNLLSSIYLKNMDEQKNIISETFEDWKGNLEQIDDVCVIGVRV